MSSLDDLLRRLDAAGPNGREEEYARVAVELTREQAFEVANSARAYAMWFALRFDAGPPGTPLPSAEAAYKAVLSAKDGSALDAYRVLFASPPVPEDAPPDLRLALLRNAAFCALKEGKLWFGTWLAARAGLAAIALGVPESAWLILDNLTVDGRRRPNLEVLADFAPIRSSETAQRSPWVRAAICDLWPQLGVPAIPSLPPPSGTPSDAPIEGTLAELSRIGATKVRALVERFANSVVRASARATLARHADEPLIRELRKRALEGSLVPPTFGELPSWFQDWARAVARIDEAHLARLAGLVLCGINDSDKQLAAYLVLPAACSADLEVLAAGFDVPELQTLFAELKVARDALPIEVADALVAVALPNHVREGEALGVLAQHLGLLQGEIAPSGGAIDRIATRVRAVVEEGQRDREAARPLLERLTDAAHREAGQLSTAGRRLSEADVERSAAKIRVPEVATGLLDAACEATQGLPALDKLLLALALRRAVADSDHREHWEAPLAKVASDSIYALREPQLFGLRLRLLDDAIRARHPLVPVAELYYQRAITRRAIELEGGRPTELPLADLRMAIRVARAEANPGLCAAATGTLVKLLVTEAAADGSNRSARQAEAESAIAEVLDLPLDPNDRATVLQARAHLVRPHDPEESVRVFEAALAPLVPKDPYWAEVAAELVEALQIVHRLEEAVARGTECLNQVPGDARGTELGMLHLALGHALLASGRVEDARRRLESGLQLVRGHDSLLAVRARLLLSSLGLAVSDGALSGQHLGFLQDHRHEMDALSCRDFNQLQAAAAAAGGDAAHHRRVLTQSLSTEKEERVRVGLHLEIARLDLVDGRAVDDLDALIHVGLKTDLDHHHDSALSALLCNHGTALARSTLEEALLWARQRQPSIVARLQHHAGQLEEARATLRAALAGDLDSHERLRCIHQLMTLLDFEERVERRALCDELERLLDIVEDVPHIRLDLAAGLRMTADKELSAIRRARTHALQALGAPLRSREREFGQQTMAQITLDLLRLSLPTSSSALAQDAEWLLDELAIGEPMATQLRLEAATLLLLPGPLTHPEMVAVAAQLLELATAPVGAQAVGVLAERLRWIRGVAAGTESAAGFTAGLRGPYDWVPDWVVRHVHGRGSTVAPDEIARAAAGLAAVARIRPDVADPLLAMAVAVQHRLSGSARKGLLDAVRSAVEFAGEVGNTDWSRLLTAIHGVRMEHDHPMLDRILSATKRSSIAEPNSAARAIDNISITSSSDSDAASAALTERVPLSHDVTAVRSLVPSEQDLNAYLAQLMSAREAPTLERVIQEAEEAWVRVRTASAYLLLDPESREREASAAIVVATHLARRLAERALAAPSNGLAFVLRGESAQAVERWIVRAQQPARRPLQARLSRPKTVSASAWDAWRDAVDSGDQGRVAVALERVRQTAPAFLAEDHANDVTWRWLEARPGSAAVVTVLAESGSLVLLMRADKSGTRDTWVLGLSLEPPPRALDELPSLIRASSPSAHSALNVVAEWIRGGIVDPIERFLGTGPTAVLWSPDPRLRLVAPNAAWRTVPVATATSVVLPDLRSSPSRRRSSLVVLADPGAEASDPWLDLHGQGVPTLQVIELAAARRGGVRLLGSVGQRFGRALLGERSDVRDTPASARDVLLEAAEHETIILLAHGEVESLEDAAVLCVDASGNIDRLDVAQLGRSPDAFAGATVLLLSCEGGRMGDSMIEPGGLAGTLLSAGAACVVAPLWPVRLDAAEQVGRAVLEGMASGEEPWAVLAKLIPQTHGDSPSLGRPAPSLSERRADQTLQRLAFVAWVG